MWEKLKKKKKLIIISEKFSKAACLQRFLTRARVLEREPRAKRARTKCTDARIIARYDRCAAFKSG